MTIDDGHASTLWQTSKHSNTSLGLGMSIVKTRSWRQRFDAAPFFWSQHYDVVVNYVDHAEHLQSLQTEVAMESEWSQRP